MHRCRLVCIALALALPCIGSARAEQGDPCTGPGAGSCTPSSGNVCLLNVPACVGGFCEYPPNVGADCNDGDACTRDERCLAGACVGEPVRCDDGVACTVDACNAASGCAIVIDHGACDDDLACTTDTCTVAGCAHSANHTYCRNTFGDGNECTVERCLGALGDPLLEGCVHDGATTDGDACSDSDACTHDDQCAGGACRGAPITCGADAFACTTQTCDPVIGCQTLFDDAACDDGNPCTIDRCDVEALDGCSHVMRPDDAVVEYDVACGDVGVCGNVAGRRVCQNGFPVLECPGYVDDIVALGDTACSTLQVAYAIVVDQTTSAPIGTIRCWRDVATETVSCDRAEPENPSSTEAKVYDGLYCPGE